MRKRALIAAMFFAVLVTGVGGSTASAATETKTDNQTKPTSYDVTIRPGDTLTKIGQANNTTYVRLYNANTNITDPDLIYAGKSLRIPAPDEQLAERPLPQKAKPAPAAPVAKPAPAPAPAAPVAKPAPAAAPAPAPKPAPAPAAKAAPAPAPAPKKPTPKATSSSAVVDGGVWDRLAQCESTGNWSIDTGNGYYGGLQFSLSSWKAVGGTGNPAHASKSEQIERAKKLQSIQGWGAWPACSAKLGLS